MQVNMYRVVLILLLAVCWVQSQSMTSSLSPASASNSVTKKQSTSSSTTARSGQEKSQSISSTMHKNSPNTTTSPSTTATFSTENKNSPNTTTSPSTTATFSTENKNSPNTTTSPSTTATFSTENKKSPNTTTSPSTTATFSTENKKSPNTTTSPSTTATFSTENKNSPNTKDHSISGTTNLTTTVATSTTPTSSTKTTAANSSSTTKLTTTVAASRTNTSSTKTIVATSTGTTNLTTTVATSTTPTSSTKTTVATSNSTTNPTNTVATSRTNTSSTNTTAITTGTTHKIGLKTTGTATNGNPKLTTELKTSSRTQSPDTTKTTTTATSTVRVTSLGKIYISEVMVGYDRDDVVIHVELFVTAKANISHYTLAVFDDTQNMMQSYQLNHQSLHDGFLTVSLNNTMLGRKTNSTGIALYDATQWIKKTLNNTVGLEDALVIGTSFQTTSARLVQVLTPGCLPIVLHKSQISENKSITRCSEERRCNSSMFMYTSPSFGKSNSAICENRWKNIDTITLKFNCSCQTCDSTSINEIIHFLIQEIDKNCQCEVTALNIIDSYVACCGGTALHATIVAADSEQKDKMMKAYQTLLHNTTTVTLGHNNYTINKECGSFCCHQTILPTDSANIKLRVAVTVTCIMVLLIIIFVVLYRRRKKRGVHQFSMVRLNEEDEDLIMDGVEDDNVVGQGATFYKNRLGS